MSRTTITVDAEQELVIELDRLANTLKVERGRSYVRPFSLTSVGIETYATPSNKEFVKPTQVS